MVEQEHCPNIFTTIAGERGTFARSKWQLRIKRLVDLLAAIPTLLLMLPLFGAMAVLIKLETPGPVFYAQDRIGKNGKLFKCIKFRTMFVNSNAVLEAYLDANPEARETWRVFKKLADDPRVTRVGRILRRLSLDEMPQVINIVRGEMSIVGPRPFLPREFDELASYAHYILSMPPGMAGMWIACGRNRLTFAQRLELEVVYTSQWSLWLDVVLFARSLIAMLGGNGAH